MDDELEERWNRNEQRRFDGLGWGLIKPGYFTHPHEVVAATIYVVGTIIALLMICAFFASGWTLLVGLADTAKGAENARNLMLSIGAMVAAPFIVWRTWIAHQQWLVGVRQSDTQNQTMHSTMLTKAIELLGTMREEKTADQKPDGTLETRTETVPNIEVRLGAIYLLRRLAEDNARDHAPIIETLCDYIRQNSLQEKQKWERTRKNEEELPSPRADIQAAINVVGNRRLAALCEERKIEPRLSLIGAFLPIYKFDGLKLIKADFSYSDLRRTHFRDSVIGNAIFDHSQLQNTVFFKSDLSKIEFSNSNFQNSNLLTSNFRHINFKYSDMSNTFITQNALVNVEFQNCNLNNSDLSFNRIKQTLFLYCQINCSDFSYSIIDKLRINTSDLKLSNFGYTNFTSIDEIESAFYNVNYTHSIFYSANLIHLSGLDQITIETCFGNNETKLPKGLVKGKNEQYWPTTKRDDAVMYSRLKSSLRQAVSKGATHEDLVALVKS